MMNRWEKLIRKTAEVRLTNEEKMRGRAHLQEFMKLRPVRDAVSPRQKKAAGLFGLAHLTFTTRVMPVFVLVGILLLAGGSVSYAAESAVPGDVLYPVKIHMNERFGKAVALSDESKAEWEAHVAERRLVEAEVLAADGRLEPDVREHLEEEFRQHAERLQERVGRIEEKAGPETSAKLSSRFEASLKAHGEVLARISERMGVATAAGSLADAVDQESEEAEQDRTHAEGNFEKKMTSPDKERAARGLQQAVEKKIAETEAFIAKMGSKAGADVIEEAEANAVAADALLLQGIALMEEGDFGGAFRILQEAHRLAEHAKLTLKMSVKFDLHVLKGRSTSEESEEEATEQEEGMENNVVEAVVEDDLDTASYDDSEEDDAHEYDEDEGEEDDDHESVGESGFWTQLKKARESHR